MKKFCIIFFVFILIISHGALYPCEKVFASPENTINHINLAEKLLIKLQNNTSEDIELEKLYLYFDILYHENTQFYSYKIEKLELLMDNYRKSIISKAREFASNENYKQAVDFLESKSELFKDKSTINSLITHYSKFYVKDGLFYCDIIPKILTINKLIAYPINAFAENSNSDELDKLYLTNIEFKNLLKELYLNDYILININDYIDYESETILKKDLYLPLNKKPLILLFNNINYYQNDNVFIDKFIIDGKNEIGCFSSKQVEKQQVSYSTDFIPILEEFINENKDFSFNNAKGIISFDKSGGILGYDINKTNPNFNLDAQTLKKIVLFLKEKGYVFAYSNFSKNINELTSEELESELNFIKEEILPIFNSIKIFISHFDYNKLNNPYFKLNDLGFNVFIDYNDNKPLIKNNLVLLSSIKINGEFLRNNFSPIIINKDKIYDHENRTKLFDA